MKIKKKTIPSKIICDVCGEPMRHGWTDWWVHYMQWRGYASPDDKEDTRLLKMGKLDVCENCFNDFKKWVKENENNS